MKLAALRQHSFLIHFEFASNGSYTAGKEKSLDGSRLFD